MSQIEKELKKYSIAEKILFILNIIIAIAIIIYSRILLATTFGKYTLTLALIVIALITILKILKKWGPKNY